MSGAGIKILQGINKGDHMLLRLSFATILTLFCLSGFASNSDKIYKTFVKDNQIKIMSYNVQNLFDSEHDAGKNDYD